MRFFRRAACAPLTEAPRHPSSVTWKDSSGKARTSHSKDCGGRVLWSTTTSGGYIPWAGLLEFIGSRGRATLRELDAPTHGSGRRGSNG